MNIDVQVNQDDLREIAAMPGRLRDETEALMRKVLDLSLNEIKGSFPRRSGRSVESFTGSLEGRGHETKAVVESDWFVTRLQEYGYAGHFRIMPSGAKSWIPEKPRRDEGYHAEPAIERVIEHLDREIAEVVDRL